MNDDLDKRREFLPPNNEAPESWLRQYDGRPSVLPSWPPPSSAAMVVVVKEPGDPGTYADVITKKAQVDDVLTGEPDGTKRLYFVVPRALILNGRMCGLTNEDFAY